MPKVVLIHKHGHSLAPVGCWVLHNHRDALQTPLSWWRHMCCGMQEAQATGPRRRGAVADIHVPEVSIFKQLLMPQSLPSWSPLSRDRDIFRQH